MKAIYNCVADNPDELTFSEGEVIVVDGEEDQEWWVSICGTGSLIPLSVMWKLAVTLEHKAVPSPARCPAPVPWMDVGSLCNHGSQSRKP